MKLKKSLVCVTILGIVLVGCHKETTKDKNQVANKATQQKTMTKVQNDVNEIMNENYDYVIKNMGIPYNTVYSINRKSLNEFDKIKDISMASYMKLVYPKYTGNNELDGSALYIDIEKGKVTNVETNAFSTQNTKLANKSADFVIEIYGNEKSSVKLEEFRRLDLGTYIGAEESIIGEIVSDASPNLLAYNKDRSKKVLGYQVNEKKEILEKENLIIITSNGKIESVKIVDINKDVKIIKGVLLG